MKKELELVSICSAQNKIPEEATLQKHDRGCKKRPFVMGQEVWLDHSHSHFLPKKLWSCDSALLRVM